MLREPAGAGATVACLPVSLPRWQWRTSAGDLSWLARKLDAPHRGRGRWVDEMHLVCRRSSSHAWLSGDLLELRWRKETGPEGFELWDAILRTRLPFSVADVARLYAAWGLDGPRPGGEYRQMDEFLGDLARAGSSVRPVRLARRFEATFVRGIPCSFETIRAQSGARWQSVSIEHEDPALIAQALGELGLDARANIDFLRGLKATLGLDGEEDDSWARKSNASIS